MGYLIDGLMLAPVVALVGVAWYMVYYAFRELRRSKR